MKIVGDKLSEWANSGTDENNADLFARSAFNRYYYSAYLTTRKLLSEIDPKWSRQGHKGIPELLKGAIIKKVKKSIKQAERSGIITNGQASKMKSTILTATSELADMLSAAYDVRVIADYEPDIQVVKNGPVFSLKNETMSSARNWSGRATSYTVSIRKILREVGIG